MEKEKQSKQSEIASYVGKLLRDNFGKGPGSVYVSISNPFVTIYVNSFLSPMERVLMDENQQKTVEKTRDLLMETLSIQIKAYLNQMVDFEIEELYYDWELADQSGLFMGVGPVNDSDFDPASEYKKIHTEVDYISKIAEKSPDYIAVKRLNRRTMVIFRKGIMVNIEKEMIKSGHEKALRIAKRSLEKRLLSEVGLNKILNAEVQDYFIDWDFNNDKSYIALILQPE